MRRLATVLLLLVLTLSACSGDGGGTGGNGPDADFVEDEPNDTQADADDIGSATTFAGTCAPEEDDWFSVEVDDGTILTVTLEWTEGPEENDLDLALYDADGDPVVEDLVAAPGDSPAQVSLALATGGTWAVLVDCFLVYGDVPYAGTVTRP